MTIMNSKSGLDVLGRILFVLHAWDRIEMPAGVKFEFACFSRKAIKEGGINSFLSRQYTAVQIAFPLPKR